MAAMNNTALPPDSPQDLVHSINNQLSLLSGHLSLLHLSKSLSEDDQHTATVMSRAIFVISEQVRLLAQMAITARAVGVTTPTTPSNPKEPSPSPHRR
jgi:hypothetical protein